MGDEGRQNAATTGELPNEPTRTPQSPGRRFQITANTPEPTTESESESYVSSEICPIYIFAGQYPELHLIVLEHPVMITGQCPV